MAPPAVWAMPSMRHTLYEPCFFMFYVECALLIEGENQIAISKFAFRKNLSPKNLSPENRCQKSLSVWVYAETVVIPVLIEPQLSIEWSLKKKIKKEISKIEFGKDQSEKDQSRKKQSH